MSKKIYITEEIAQRARADHALSVFEDRVLNLMTYRLRMIEITDGAGAGTYRKELKTLVKAADLIFGPGAGTRLKKQAKKQPAYFAKDGGQAGTSPASDGAGAGTLHSVSAKLTPYGGWAGTSLTIHGRAAGTSDGATAGASDGAKAGASDGAKAGTRAGRKGGTAAYTYGREAGVFVEQLPQSVADGWKAGRHVSADGAGAGTPLQQAAAQHQDGAKAGTPATTMEPGQGSSMAGGQAPLDVNWTPFDDFAVGGSYGSYDDGATAGTRAAKVQGRYLSKLIAQKRGR